MQRIIFIAFCLCCLVGNAQLVGPWNGTIEVGLQKLPLVFHISAHDDAYGATLDSPEQGAYGIPAEMTVNADTVSISITALGAKYQGVYGEGAIRGNFEQHGMSFPLSLQSGEYVPVRPQTPQPPFPYRTEDVSFTNPADGYQLHGTLTLPLQYIRGNKPFNAVVMVTGSGTQNRDEEIFGHKPFAVIAHYLAMNGVASLRYDDRGYADTIPHPEITTATNAADAKAAIDFLRANVDRLNKVGVLGHSEGGTIAFILAANGDADFVVSLAGSAVSGDQILIKQNQLLLQNMIGAELTQAYTKALSRTYEYMKLHPEAKEWLEIEQELAPLQLPAQLVDNLKAVIAQRNAWFDYFISYDPADAIKNTMVPVFAANGTLDMQVDCEQNLGAIRSLLPENPASEIKECPGLNHLMQTATTGAVSEYGQIEETISPVLLKALASWLKALK